MVEGFQREREGERERERGRERARERERETEGRVKIIICFHSLFPSCSRVSLSLKIKKMDVVFLLKQALAHVVAERSVPPTPLLKELVSKVRLCRGRDLHIFSESFDFEINSIAATALLCHATSSSSCLRLALLRAHSLLAPRPPAPLPSRAFKNIKLEVASKLKKSWGDKIKNPKLTAGPRVRSRRRGVGRQAAPAPEARGRGLRGRPEPALS